MRKVVIGIVLGALGFYAYDRHAAARRPPPPPAPLAEPATAPVEQRDSSSVTSGFRCDGRKYCSQMTSCAEATWFLQNCPGVEMDGEGDGVPCERQWCGRH